MAPQPAQKARNANATQDRPVKAAFGHGSLQVRQEADAVVLTARRGEATVELHLHVGSALKLGAQLVYAARGVLWAQERLLRREA